MTAPLWFRAPFRILRLFVREKLRDRVFTVSVPQVKVINERSGSIAKAICCNDDEMRLLYDPPPLSILLPVIFLYFQLGAHIPNNALPRTLGGQLDSNHSAWLAQCHQILSSTDLWGSFTDDTIPFDQFSVCNYK